MCVYIFIHTSTACVRAEIMWQTFAFVEVATNNRKARWKTTLENNVVVFQVEAA